MAKLPAKRRPALVGAFATRPRLAASILAGLVAGLAIGLLPGIRPSTAVLLGWDVVCAVFVGLMSRYMRNQAPDGMRAHAAEADEGRMVVLLLIVAATVASIAAMAVDLSSAKQETGISRAVHVGLVFLTVALSWYFVQLNFALHYAHAYYDRAAGGRGDKGGLNFPGNAAPDYWDFLHFSIIIGVAQQTADIAFTDKGLRRLGTFHSLFAFAFNMVVVALTINLVAGLF